MNQLALALSACGRVLRPVVRLALALGLKQPHLQELLNDLLLDEAQRSWRAKGTEANLSQLSVTTGMNRKAVTSRVRMDKEALVPTEMSAAAKVFTLWLQMAIDDPALQRLPVVGSPTQPSFESVAWLASRGNVHHRTLLDELGRLDMVIDHGSEVELKSEGFIPAQDLAGMLAFFADNGRDHLDAAVSNILSERPPLLERSVYAQGLTLEDCEGIHQLVRARWATLHHELAHEMRKGVDREIGGKTARIRIGIYAYAEDASGKTVVAGKPDDPQNASAGSSFGPNP